MAPHGDTKFIDSVIDSNTIKGIQDVSHLAPLHNTHNINGIKIMQSILNKKVATDVALHGLDLRGIDFKV